MVGGLTTTDVGIIMGSTLLKGLLNQKCFCVQLGSGEEIQVASIDPTLILRKILSGDITVYTEGHSGIGFDYSWIDLTVEEAEFIDTLMQGELDE